MIPTSLKTLRITGFIEGISSVVLFGIAMPLKYFADMPMAVKIVGTLHGGLWMIYTAAALFAAVTNGWGFMKMVGAFIASIIPIGPFFFDSWVIREHLAKQPNTSTT